MLLWSFPVWLCHNFLHREVFWSWVFWLSVCIVIDAVSVSPLQTSYTPPRCAGGFLQFCRCCSWGLLLGWICVGFSSVWCGQCEVVLVPSQFFYSLKMPRASAHMSSWFLQCEGHHGPLNTEFGISFEVWNQSCSLLLSYLMGLRFLLVVGVLISPVHPRVRCE